jgi:DNA (cytosine-5)-methyltransferase 1
MLEQVPGYLTSDCFKQICQFLLEKGYWYDYKIINMADYGVPQSRKRLILLAGLGAFWSFPEEERKVGWLEAIAGTSNHPTHPTTHQKNIITRQHQLIDSVDYLIQRTSIDHAVRFSREPCWTLTRSMFTDTRQAARTNVINAHIDGEYLNLSMRAIARLSSFPDWFDLDFKHIGQGIGYAVPPYFVKKCIEQILPVKSIKSKGEKDD